ncbi:uncharacterized protein IUM83_12918 [Phytophthora cinnamomi]|uniref:uncharacterized protein n=1 Tax=Phytophthora cinnamomi TaxID=4785 RepID=UPI002A27C652|nr:hypothetical protein IUM83_12918 [Phytophthora cinnamomi]KAJ8552598.1 hypothetical protein ON010_g9949 [Phytophthora cinnamomi]
MSNKRFTVNPFEELTLTTEDRAKLIDIADAIVLAKVEEYEEYLNNEKRVDLTRWKKFTNSGATTCYLERKKVSTNSKMPETLMVGPLPGTLDENMFGLISPTLESMRIKSSYLNDFSAAAVLATIVEPTEEDPLRSVVVKWMEIDIPGASIGIVRNRDYVYLESTGVMRTTSGGRVGYHVLHSVNFPQTRKLPSRIRGNMSLCCIFHQEGPDMTACRGTGIQEPGGDIIRVVAVMGMVHATMAGLKYSYCGQMKKLAWLLEKKHAEFRDKGTPVTGLVCVTCSKPTKSSRFGKSSSTCKLCFGALCGSCKVSKKLSFIAPDLELSQRKVTFCVKCLVETTKMDTLEAARQELVFKENIQSRSYGFSIMSSDSEATFISH